MDGQLSPSFPLLDQRPTGIARMAAEAEFADDGHLIEFRAMKVRSLLNRSVSKRLKWMAYSINPYRGCEFGCKYCYARYTHEFMAPKIDAAEVRDGDGAVGTASGPDRVEQSRASAPSLANLRDPGGVSERRIFIKQNAAWAAGAGVEEDRSGGRDCNWGQRPIPYQPRSSVERG